jgi:hypothetical protein
MASEARIIVEAGGVVNIHAAHGCEQVPAAQPSIAALQALAELEHVANLSLPDDATVTLQVGFLRPRLAVIREALR